MSPWLPFLSSLGIFLEFRTTYSAQRLEPKSAQRGEESVVGVYEDIFDLCYLGNFPGPRMEPAALSV